MRKKRQKHTYVFKRNASLKKEVYKQIKESNIKIYKEIRSNKSPLWAPSLLNLIIFLIGTVILGLFSHIHELGILPVSVSKYFNLHLVIKSNDYMIAICIGIGAVLIGLAFFVAQSFLDKEDPDRGRVLLYTSNFYFLLIGDISILLMYVFGKPNMLTDILIVLLSFFTIKRLYLTVKVLLYVNEMEKARLILFKGIIRRFILHELCRRISYQEFFRANEKLKIKYGKISANPFIRDNNFITFHSIAEGTIVDINLGVYERLYILLSKKLSQINLINAQIKTNNIPDEEEKTREKEDEKIILCLKSLPYAKVDKKTVLFGINKVIEDNNPSIKNKIRNTINRLFIIKKLDFEKEAELEISKAQQRSMIMISQDNPDAFKISLRIYEESINEFFDILKRLNLKFDKEQAAKLRVAFLGERLKLLDWITDSFTSILYKSVRSDNLHIIREALYLPISFSKSAIKINDHLIFQNFIQYPVIMYIEGYLRKQTNKQAFKFIIDRSWRYLKELSDFFLEDPYEEGEIDEQDFLDYSFYIFNVFQDLLKQSYDKRDIESFKIYLSKYMSLYEYLNYSTRYKITGQSTFEKVNVLRNQTLFGIGSWIFNRHLEHREEANKVYLNDLFQAFKLDIVNLTALFIDVHKHRNGWGWEDWEMDSKEEGMVHTLTIPRELERFYIIICLRLLQGKPDIENFELPFSSELASLTNTLLEVIKSIQDEPEKWDLISENQILKCYDLIRLLERAKEQEQEKEVELIRKTPISLEKVRSFKAGILKSMDTVQGIKSLIKYYEAIIFEEKRSDSKDKFGINTFYGKEWFIDTEELNTTWIGLDEQIGESMINGENQNILQKLHEEAQEIPDQSFEDYLDSIKDIKNVVIIAVNYQPYDFFKNKNDLYIANWYANFSDKWFKEFPDGIDGVLNYKQNRIPVYEYFNSLSFKGVLIVDFKNLKLIQYPLELNGDERFITIDVQGFELGSHEEDEIIEHAPEWLKNIGNEKAQRQYIEERVIVKVFEQFDLIIGENAVAKIPLE